MGVKQGLLLCDGWGLLYVWGMKEGQTSLLLENQRGIAHLVSQKLGERITSFEI